MAHYDSKLVQLFADAHSAGVTAAQARTPTPMIVVEHTNPLNDNSPIKRVYEPVMDGVCGFAWIVIRPGNCTAARYAKEYFGAHKGYGGGVHIWVSYFNQSYEKKMAYASAFAKVLYNAGINAYADGRLD